MVLAVKMSDTHYPLCKSIPKVGDTVYVPTFLRDETKPKSILNANRFAGAATVESVRKCSKHGHYVTVTEFTGYFEIHWENDLAHLQTSLAQECGYNRAYIKF